MDEMANTQKRVSEVIAEGQALVQSASKIL